jgi:hypothetical protein
LGHAVAKDADAIEDFDLRSYHAEISVRTIQVDNGHVLALADELALKEFEAFRVDRHAPRKPRPEGRGRGELSQNGEIPFRAAKHCRKAEPPPGRAGRLHILEASQNRLKLRFIAKPGM